MGTAIVVRDDQDIQRSGKAPQLGFPRQVAKAALPCTGAFRSLKSSREVTDGAKDPRSTQARDGTGRDRRAAPVATNLCQPSQRLGSPDLVESSPLSE